jgi:ParB family chromosome partitioning protein
MSKKANQTIDLGFLRGESTHTDLSGMFASSVATESDMQQAAMVKIEKLLNNPYQPRIETADTAIEELAQVIGTQGFQGVLVARPDPVNRGFYQLTAGHRRRDAAKRAGLSALPVVVRELTDEEMVTLAITENIQREDLTALEEGKIYLLMAEEMGYTHEQIAREVGRKRGYIENRIRVARAPRDIQALVQAKPDSLRAVATLIKVGDEGERAEIIEHMKMGKLTVEDLTGYLQSKEAAVAPLAATNGKAEMQYEGTGIPSAAPIKKSRTANRTVAPSSEKDAMRIGRAKLKTIVSNLNSYKQMSAGRATISPQERASLVLIRALVEELHSRYNSAE